MPINLSIWERRDNGNRETMAVTALELCRVVRKVKGITSARFYWVGTEEIVFITEGETSAFNSIAESPPTDYIRHGFVLQDNAKQTLSKRLMDPRAATQATRSVGR